MYLTFISSNIDGNKVNLIQFRTIDTEILSISNISTFLATPTCRIIIFEEDTSPNGIIPPRFTLDTDEYRSLFQVVSQVVPKIVSKRLKYLQPSRNQFVQYCRMRRQANSCCFLVFSKHVSNSPF